MTDVVDEPGYNFDTTLFDKLVGEEFVVHVLDHADERVKYRLLRAADHYNKAIKLFGLDDEMAMIRLIAAEEELVVAIIRHVTLKADVFPDTGKIFNRFDDHRVKQAFIPTLSRFWTALEGQFRRGISFDGLEHIKWTYKPFLDEGKFKLGIFDSDERKFAIDPLSATINRDDLAATAVVEEMLAEMEGWAKETQGQSVADYIKARANYRNQLLYAYDDYPIAVMGDSIEALHKSYEKSFRGLLYVLTAIVNNDPPSREWGVACQFFALYRHVLAAVGVGKPPEATEADFPEEYFILNVKAAGPAS